MSRDYSGSLVEGDPVQFAASKRREGKGTTKLKGGISDDFVWGTGIYMGTRQRGQLG